MQSLDKAIPKKDLATGIGTSLLVHVLIFGGAVLSVMLIPHKPLPAPYCSVDLVSMNDIGAGAAEPKGEPGASGRGAVKSSAHHGVAHRKARPVVAIRRLAVNEPAENMATHIKIKQIAPKDAPVTHERARGVEAIDKNLDKLVARPKTVPRLAPPPTRNAEHETATRGRSSNVAQKESARVANVAQNETGGRSSNEPADAGEEGPAGGTPNGRARGGRQGSSPGGSAYGSTNGAASRILGMYGQVVKEKIQREWNLANDKGVGGLRTVVQVQIRESGEIVRVVVMQRSGNELFDASAVRAVNRAGPLPPVPAAARASVAQSLQFILTFKPGKVA